MDQAQTLREQVAAEKRKGGHPLRVIGIVSGKGGVGKTHFAANLAVLAAKSGKRVLIVDADLGLANVEILYGITPRYHIGHLLDGTCSPDTVLAEGPHGVRILPAGSGLQTLTRLDDAQKLRLVTALDSFEDAFDVVLIDSGAGIGDNVMFFVGAAQEALLVVNPEPTSLTDAYAAVKVLSLQAHVRHFNVVVNQAQSNEIARDIFQRLCAVSGRFLDAKLRYVGFVPRDENMHRAVMAQRPLIELFPLSPASRALATIADGLFSERPAVHLGGGLKFLWQRFFRESPSAVGG
jgi:flagellar biosynthesis protein FlhG